MAITDKSREVAWRPDRHQLAAATSKKVPDVIATGLKVLFCGINPGLYSAAVGHHFARPGNRFWPALAAAGFTDRQFSPFEDHKLVEKGLGITNLVERATAAADELSVQEFRAGAKCLQKKLRRFRPGFIAFCGIGAYRLAFGNKHAIMGIQEDQIAETRIWILPNPSGLNAHYQISHLTRMFQSLRNAADKSI